MSNNEKIVSAPIIIKNRESFTSVDLHADSNANVRSSANQREKTCLSQICRFFSQCCSQTTTSQDGTETTLIAPTER